jgi:hypothetical protein
MTLVHIDCHNSEIGVTVLRDCHPAGTGVSGGSCCANSGQEVAGDAASNKVNTLPPPGTADERQHRS